MSATPTCPPSQGALGDQVVIRGALAVALELTLADPFLTGDPYASEWV